MANKTKAFTVFLLLFPIVLFSQVNADFTASVTSGCAPLLVTFTNLSTGSNLSYTWIFENGQSSTLANPTIPFNNPGSYFVKLVVTNGTSTDEIQKDGYITVWGLPTASFSTLSDTMGCAPVVIDFIDQSIMADAAITGWTWSFDDGSLPDHNQNPTHTFNTLGSFEISLQVIDANNCESEYFTIVNFITVTPMPVASFAANPTSSCDDSLLVQFTNNSTGFGGYTSEWDFGNSDTSSVNNPSTTYMNQGTYTATLIVTDSEGCKDSTSVDIGVAEIVAGYEVGINDTICPGVSTHFTNTSSAEATSFQWIVNGNLVSTVEEPSLVFPNIGDYEVMLIVTSAGGCKDTVTRTIYSEYVAAGFIVDPVFGCEVPHTVTLTDTSINSVAWNWQRPNNVTFSNAQDTAYTFTSQGSYAVYQEVTSPHGCKSETSVIVVIGFPDASFTIGSQAQDSCERTITFTDNSTSVDPIVSWLWDFGDADPPQLVLAQNPTHTFNYNDFVHSNQGECNVQLIITTEQGCKDSIEMLITVGIKPQVQYFIFSDPDTIPYFDTLYHSCGIGCYTGDEDDPCPADCWINPYIGCAWPDTLMFYDSSYVYYQGQNYYSEDSLIDEWMWDFGEPAGSANDTNPDYAYWTDADTVGWMDIELIVGYHQCYDTLTTDSMVYILGPLIRSVDSSYYCSSPYEYNILVDLVSATSYAIYIRDMNLDSIVFHDSIAFYTDTTLVDSVPFTFPDNSDYQVYIYAYNDSTCGFPENYWYNTNPAWIDTVPILHRDSCMAIDSSLIIPVREIIVDFLYDSVICGETFYPYSGMSSNDAVQFSWAIEDTNYVGPIAVHTFYPFVGTHLYDSVKLTVTDQNGCKADTTGYIDVYKPIAEFTWDSISRCLDPVYNVNFFNVPHSDTNLVSWHWDFGDVSNDTSLTVDSVSYNYYTPGTYNVTHWVFDTLGCGDTIRVNQLIKHSNPIPNFTINDGTICVGDSVHFINSSQATNNINLLSYMWYFGDGDSSSAISPWNVYDSTGLYTITLVVDEMFGCKDTIIQSLVNVQIADPTFAPDVWETQCNNIYVTFSSLDSTDYAIQWTWDFDEPGEDPIVTIMDSTANFYETPGEYLVSLTILTSNGCSASMTLDSAITIGGPAATVVIDPLDVCKGDTVEFSMIDTVNLVSWQWFFGDGNTSFESPAFHIYDIVNTQLVTLWIYSDESGDCKDFIEAEVNVYDVYASMSANDSVACSNVTSTFSFDNQSSGETSVAWNFGDGNTSTSTGNVSHTYDVAGDYTIVLTILNDQVGCNDSDTLTVHIFDPPEVTVSPDTIICYGSSTIISGNEQDIMTWTSLDNFDLINDSTIEVSPLEIQNYTYTVGENNLYNNNVSTINCFNNATVEIDVIPDFDEFVSPINDTIFVGDSIQLLAWISDSLLNIGYSWSPYMDLSCNDCPSPYASPLSDVTYTITFSNYYGCDSVQLFSHIVVIPVSDLDVPTAFTPNGDGVNDHIMLKGRGIYHVDEFTIFNRWGKQIFSIVDRDYNSLSVEDGWDGYVNGVLQSMDTYIYQASVKYYNGTSESKNGNFTLIR